MLLVKDPGIPVFVTLPRIAAAFVCAVMLVPPVCGAPTTPNQAEQVVTRWLTIEDKPLGVALSHQIDTVGTFSDAAGEPLYYVVRLKPSGFVVVPADDGLEPIICFAPSGMYDPSRANPLAALITGDLSNRMTRAKALQAPGSVTAGMPGDITVSREKWRMLLDLDGGPSKGIPNVSDERVPPLVQSSWNQKDACGEACYNYYTPQWTWDFYDPPQGPAGHVAWNENDSANYPCGCVATAMAQLMRHREYPSTSVAGTSGVCWLSYCCDPYQSCSNYPCAECETSPFSRSLIGGSGTGGAYDWDSMPLNPAANCATLTQSQRAAIGALCYDAGTSVMMDYSECAPGADTLVAADALRNTFGYANAVKGWNGDSDIGTALNEMVNPNLDAAWPVLLGINGIPGGHAVVCDGYGYASLTLYHHLNLGWANSDTAWYSLPTIDTSQGTFSSVYKCVYNVFTHGTGEIISGRITDPGGNTIQDVAVAAQRVGGGTYTAATNGRGVYALTNVPSGSTYRVRASKSGNAFYQQTVTTGTSLDGGNAAGNRWGVDFVSATDCNTNGIPDACDLACGPSGGPCDLPGCGASQDCNTNGAPDECEPDGDGDGVIDACDNCPGVSNPTQADSNSNGIGDACETSGDFDHDGDVDMADFAHLQACFTGAGVPPGPGCADTNLDGDGDVDGEDYTRFRAYLAGPNNPPHAPPSGMVLIPAGEFQMGDTFSEGSANERPVHAVYIDAFYMDTYEVTNQQYAVALNWAKDQGNLITVPPIGGTVYKYNSGTDCPYCDTTTSSSSSQITWNGTTFGVVSGKENHPMVMVSWYGAVACANWRSGMQGKAPCYDLSTWTCTFGSGYRLPTEAEWEKAARGGAAGHRFAWSDTDTIQHSRANYCSSSSYAYDTSPTSGYHPMFKSGPQPFTSPVGYFAPNGYGLYDMTGNVFESCNDWYGGTYSSSPTNNPHGPASGTHRMQRGGSWYHSAYYGRCSDRNNPEPDRRDDYSGFRLALDAE